MAFNGNLKEFCLGMTVRGIKDCFKDNYNPLTKQIFCDGLYYQLAIDRLFADEDDNVCVDLWIDWKRSDILKG